jgi:hypothetical protein
VKFKGHWNGELYRYKVTAYNVHDREIVAIYKKRGTLFLRPPSNTWNGHLCYGFTSTCTNTTP